MFLITAWLKAGQSCDWFATLHQCHDIAKHILVGSLAVFQVRLEEHTLPKLWHNLPSDCGADLIKCF